VGGERPLFKTFTKWIVYYEHPTEPLWSVPNMGPHHHPTQSFHKARTFEMNNLSIWYGENRSNR